MSMNSRPRQLSIEWRDLPIWLRAIALVAIINFAVFIIIELKLGGDAVNGYEKDGKYFLASHGAYTEVSEAVWTYSYYHAIAVFITHSSVFVGAAVAIWHSSKRKKKIAEQGAFTGRRDSASVSNLPSAARRQ